MWFDLQLNITVGTLIDIDAGNLIEKGSAGQQNLLLKSRGYCRDLVDSGGEIKGQQQESISFCLIQLLDRKSVV